MVVFEAAVRVTQELEHPRQTGDYPQRMGMKSQGSPVRPRRDEMHGRPAKDTQDRNRSKPAPTQDAPVGFALRLPLGQLEESGFWRTLSLRKELASGTQIQMCPATVAPPQVFGPRR